MFRSSAFAKGAFWFVMVSVVSACNDALVKLVGTHLSAIQITFFRFFFSMVTLLPFMLAKGPRSFITPHWKIHGIRSLFLVLAILPWSYGVIHLSLPLVTTISFTTPLFVLVLSVPFLREKIGLHRTLATALGFAGIVISAQPSTAGMNWSILFLITSTLLFASLDIINKKMLIKNETLLPMLFFSAVGTTLLCFPLVLKGWVTPYPQELALLFLLGAGANLILFFLLKAFQFCDLSALQPLRYSELVISSLLSLVLFSQLPEKSTLLGAAFIIPATLYIAYVETRKRKKNQPPEATLHPAEEQL